MNVTVSIDEALLTEAEEATNIHDWSVLVKEGLQSLSQRSSSSDAAQAPFDFDVVLTAAAELPDLSDADFHELGNEMQRPLPASWS